MEETENVLTELDRKASRPSPSRSLHSSSSKSRSSTVLVGGRIEDRSGYEGTTSPTKEQPSLSVTPNNPAGFKKKDVMQKIRKKAMNNYLENRPSKRPVHPPSRTEHERSINLRAIDASDIEGVPSLMSSGEALKIYRMERARRPSPIDIKALPEDAADRGASFSRSEWPRLDWACEGFSDEREGDVGIIVRVVQSMTELFSVLVQRTVTDPLFSRKDHDILQRCLHTLKLWADGHEALSGRLDQLLERSEDLQHTTLDALFSLFKVISKRLFDVSFRNETQEARLAVKEKADVPTIQSQVKSILARLDKYYESDGDSESDSDADFDDAEVEDDVDTDNLSAVIADVKYFTQCLIDLNIALDCPAFDPPVRCNEDPEARPLRTMSKEDYTGAGSMGQACAMYPLVAPQRLLKDESRDIASAQPIYPILDNSTREDKRMRQAPAETSSIPATKSDYVTSPHLKAHFPSNHSVAGGPTAGILVENWAGGEVESAEVGADEALASGVLLHPPSPSAGALPSPGASGSLDPFARLRRRADDDESHDKKSFEAPPSSPLPSRFADNDLNLSPSSFYPGWIFGRDENKPPSPLTIQIPTSLYGLGFGGVGENDFQAMNIVTSKTFDKSPGNLTLEQSHTEADASGNVYSSGPLLGRESTEKQAPLAENVTSPSRPLPVYADMMEVFQRLGFSELNPEHNALHKEMMEEAEASRVWLSYMSKNSCKMSSQTARPPYDWADLPMPAIDAEISGIERAASDHIKPYYERGRYGTWEGANWVIRWYLWNSFYARKKKFETGHRAPTSTKMNRQGVCLIQPVDTLERLKNVDGSIASTATADLPSPAKVTASGLKGRGPESVYGIKNPTKEGLFHALKKRCTRDEGYSTPKEPNPPKGSMHETGARKTTKASPSPTRPESFVCRLHN